MKIGIIGAGNIGGTLARRFRKLNHEVQIANSRGPESLATLVKETGARPLTVNDAVKGVDLVIIAIPVKSIEQLPHDLFQGVPESVPVVDTGNYHPNLRDGVMPNLEKAPSASTWVSNVIGRPVIKVFNNIPAPSLGTAGVPRGSQGRIALPISGDDPKAKASVMRLVEELGFDAVDAGSLAESWRQEPGTPAYCTNLDAEKLEKALANVDRDRSQRLSKIAEEQFMHLPPNFTSDMLVKAARDLQKAA
jgi:8-hydroxy-5-deazaflavin:NADPH oxidoreductase